MRTYRAGDTVEELCRACKIDRLHTVIATDAGGRPVRVQCDFCGSQHNSRGGGSERAVAGPQAAAARTQTIHASVMPNPSRPAFLRASDLEQPRSRPPMPRPAEPSGARLVREAPSAIAQADRHPDGADAPLGDARVERAATVQAPVVEGSSDAGSATTMADLERVLRHVIREEAGLTPVEPAERWRGGTLVVRAANPDLQDKIWPIDVFFHKIVMIRNRLRTLEQQVNAMDVPEDVKVRLQAYITGCYGTLTSFNVLFADAEDMFHGMGE